MSTAKIQHTKKELLWGRIAAKTVYFMLGVGSGTFAANIPRIKDNLLLSPSALGVALLCGSLGGFVAMQLAPPLIKRLGLRLLIALLAPTFPFVLILIAVASNFPLVALAFMLFGGVTSVTGIAMNAHAIDIERAYARTIMSSFYALFSIGGLVGATVGGLMAAQHISVHASMTIVALSLSVLGVALITKLFDVTKYDFTEDHPVITKARKHHRHAWWRQVAIIGSLMFVCFLTEGAIADWSTIYMKNVYQAGPLIAVMAYMAFNGMMTIGRLVGDPIIRRVGAIQTLIAGGSLGVIGLAVGLLSPGIPVALVGFGTVGVGLSVLVPILISMAGNLSGGDRNLAIARVSTFGSVGLMVGPAVIGFVAQASNLLSAMLIPVGLLLVLVFVSLTMYSSVKQNYQSEDIII